MDELFAKSKRRVRMPENDKYIGDTHGIWVDLQQDQYVEYDMIYEMAYKIIEADTIKCPICNEIFYCSEYLSSVITDNHALWLANMVTHWRHDHTKWDKAYSYYNGYEDKYEREKIIRNERAKRQILRKAKNFLIENGFNVSHFKMLHNAEKETIELAKKILNPLKETT